MVMSKITGVKMALEKITPEGKRINVIDLTNLPPPGKESAQTPC
jgi:hypothetical protein